MTKDKKRDPKRDKSKELRHRAARLRKAVEHGMGRGRA